MRFVVTGGAGFIGSHLADGLLSEGAEICVVDNLATGLATNVPATADFIEADIRDVHALEAACKGAEVIFHLAALGSVPRSIETPLATDQANVHGTLSVLETARKMGVQRVVAASSSSVYGGEAPLPTKEHHPLAPKSPYAVSKVAGELYSRVYADVLGVETVCLRYFNVYGPRQRADSAYAAAIPRFIDAMLAGQPVTVFGDGHQTRDFTFVLDAVQATMRAGRADGCAGRVFNIAGGTPASIIDVIEALQTIIGTTVEPVFADPRPGDVARSHADISAAREELGYDPDYDLIRGLSETVSVMLT